MKKTSIFTIALCIFIFIFTIQISSGVTDVERCKDCHGKIVPIPRDDLTKDCLVCHQTHGTGLGCCQPATRVPEKVHNIHVNAFGDKVPFDGGCRNCHKKPLDCTDCHNSHKNVNVTGPDVCTDCHGNLPQPQGHEDFRKSLSENKHKWMNCQTCHINPFKIGDVYNFRLHFKNIFETSIDDSINLCKICHSLQYGEMKNGTHGAINKTCIDCHNPHTTSLSGPTFQMTNKETTTHEDTPKNVSDRVDSTTDWLTTNIPILQDPVALIIIILVVSFVAADHILSKNEEGKKVAYDMVKINANEKTLKTLEMKLSSKDINVTNQILERNGINILGMTMKKEDTESGDSVYKYIIFIDTVEAINEKSLVDLISGVDNVKSVKFTDKYEL